ncbi:MAG TPA: NDP-sugar synthase [Vicinamibacterales bacterium]|nr:NDP-sugar synthase [Vicinamibacterales bacterium]
MIDLSEWPALVLTAGLATRLRPVSDVRAKAAMPVAGTPIIGRILSWLREAGVRRVVLNLHHRPETITRIVGDGAEWDLQVRYSWEKQILGSAGGPRRAVALLEATRFLIVNGDTLTDCDVQAVAAHHLETRARVTMAVVPGDVARYGGVLIRPDGFVQGFGKPTADTHALHFIGVQAVDASVFDDVPDDQPSETVRTLYPRLIGERADAIAAYESAAEFLDVGTAADYLSTVATVAARERRRFDIGVDCDIAPDAVLKNTVLWDCVTVGAGAELINCVVTDDVEVPADARFAGSALVATPDGMTARPF